MLFRRKKKEKEVAGSARGAEARRYYRRAPGKKHALSVKVRTSADRSVSGELVDLSAGGAAVLCPAGDIPGLGPGAPVSLRFSSLIHGKDVETAAQVARAPQQADAPWGFEFTDVPGLFQQLDTYFLKFFNRRRAIRVQPALDTKIVVRLQAPSGPLEGRLVNVSVDGLGVGVDPALAESLGAVEALDVEFTIPRVKVRIPWQAHRSHVSASSRGTVFGARFDPRPAEGLEDERSVLAEYVDARAAEMARWDAV